MIQLVNNRCIWVEVDMFLLFYENKSDILATWWFGLTYVSGPVRMKLMCSTKFYVKQIGNQGTNVGQ